MKEVALFVSSKLSTPGFCFKHVYPFCTEKYKDHGNRSGRGGPG